MQNLIPVKKIKATRRGMRQQELLIPPVKVAIRIKEGAGHLIRPIPEVMGTPGEAVRAAADQLSEVLEETRAPVPVEIPAEVEDQEGQKAQAAEVPKESNRSVVIF